MGLEAPLALLGLLAALIPILVHRMRNRELPAVVLPTYALLLRAAAKSQHKRALTDLLLLLVRVAVVVLAALALSAPFVSMRLHFGDGQVSNLALVIDDSLSMGRREGAASLLDEARARALDVIGALPEGSELSVVLAGKPARVLVPLTRDLVSVRRSLESATLSAVRSNDLNNAVELAQRQQNRGLTGPRQLLILSDFAGHAGIDSDALPLDGAGVSVERIGVAPTRANLSFAEVHATPDPTRPHEISIAVDVRASGAAELPRPEHVRVEIDLAGKLASSAELTLEHDAGHAILHVPAPEPNNPVEARLRLVGDDASAADNERSIVLGREGTTRILLVNGDPRPAERSDELYYATRALSLLPESVLSLRVRSIDALSLEHADLHDDDVIVLANAPTPSDATARHLIEFVEAGGGLIIAAGSRVDPNGYNAQLGPILPSHIRANARAGSLRLALGKRAQFLSEGLSGLREVRVQQRLLLENTGADELLSFEDGAPALSERSVGEGRCLILATSLDADFGDLPLRPGFLPLLAAMIREAAGPAAAARLHVAPGETVTLPMPAADGFMDVSRPDGKSQRFLHGGDELPRFSATDALGVYRIRTGRSGGDAANPVRSTFVVDPPRDEADLTPGPLPRVAGRALHKPSTTSVHKPLGGGVLLAFFGLVVLESLLRMRRRGFARQPS
jgi:antitoxin (DNA-binding transcriptional repressor) of toxin-antitoxin stability system